MPKILNEEITTENTKQDKVLAFNSEENLVKQDQENQSNQDYKEYLSLKHNTLLDQVFQGVNIPTKDMLQRAKENSEENQKANTSEEDNALLLAMPKTSALQYTVFKEITCKVGNAVFTFSNADEVFANITRSAGINTSKLLLALLGDIVKGGFSSNIAKISLGDYANLIGLTGVDSKKEARKKVNEGLKILKNISIATEFSQPTKRGRVKQSIEISLYGGTQASRIEETTSGGIKNGEILFSFNPTFLQTFSDSTSIFMIPNEIFLARTQTEAMLLYKLFAHKRVNIGKSNEDIIPAREIYEFCISLKRYEEVKEKGGKLHQLIIDPIEKLLSDNSELFDWYYVPETLPPSATIKTFAEFEKAKIQLIWKKDPGKYQEIRAKKKTKQLKK